MTTPQIGSPPRVGNAVKPKLTDEELRLECAKLAVQAHVQPALLVDTAKKLHDFVKSGTA